MQDFHIAGYWDSKTELPSDVSRKAFGKAKPGEDAHSAAGVLRREYEKLGPITYVRRMCLCIQGFYASWKVDFLRCGKS